MFIRKHVADALADLFLGCVPGDVNLCAPLQFARACCSYRRVASQFVRRCIRNMSKAARVGMSEQNQCGDLLRLSKSTLEMFTNGHR